MNKTICQYLEWDSIFFGLKIARIGASKITPSDAENIMEWCNINHIDCLYFLVETDDPETIRVAEDNGFRLMDIRLTLEKSTNEMPVSIFVGSDFQYVIRPCKFTDVTNLKAIARTGHQSTRFYYDQNFPRTLCGRLYETWIEKSCDGYAACVLVADFHDMPIGYISCHNSDNGNGQIGLLGVHAEFQQKGIGMRLVAASMQWFADRGIKKVSVVTQGSNCSAQRMYQRCGFLTKSTQLWYHKWFLREK